ncbi:MAG TPA: class I SAM-dependent methyltransferase [Gaiellaceae bacterium]|nr:class I SAM-dependent methyltransferase [Gaiellaceae bacterium]
MLHDACETQADNWTRWAREPNFDSYWVFHREHFLALLPPPGRLTLDVGCGEGRVTRDLRALAHRVVGVDAAPSMVAAARDVDPGGEYLVADAAELPFEDGSADLVVSFMSLMDMEDMPAAVREIGRVLTQGGRLLAAVAHPVNTAGSFAEDGRFRTDSYLERRRVTDDIERDGLVMIFHARHLILEDYSRALEAAGLVFEGFREIYNEEDPRWHRVPLFLDFRAVRQ